MFRAPWAPRHKRVLVPKESFVLSIHRGPNKIDDSNVTILTGLRNTDYGASRELDGLPRSLSSVRLTATTFTVKQWQAKPAPKRIQVDWPSTKSESKVTSVINGQIGLMGW